MSPARLLVVALLIACAPAIGQLQLYTVATGGAETAVGAVHEVGPAAAGDVADTRFRIRNTGATLVVLQRLLIAGVGFSLVGDPELPFRMTAGVNVDFRVRFRPPSFGAYSANLDVNGRSTILRGASPPAAALLFEQDGRWLAASVETPIDFGRIERGEKVSRRFQLSNPTSVVVSVSALSVVGRSFQGPAGVAPPLVVEPRESVTFEVGFAPQSAGIQQGTLLIDQRGFRLEGIAVDPPLPEPELVTPVQALASAQQGKVSVRLASPARASGTGTLALEFQPAVAGTPDDSAIRFLANGSRSLSLAVREGESEVLLAGQPEAVFQTGTTAGTIQFTLRVGTHTRQASLTIPPAPIGVDSTRTGRIPTGVEVLVSGFDNTRTVSQLSFAFFDRQGRPLGTAPIRADAAEDFRRFFQSSTLGGVFLLRAAFPVAGNAALIGAVEVELTNSAGSSAPRRVAFPD